jgi:hypothetical protein
MPVPITSTENVQQIEVGITGPGDARRMIVVMGIANVTLEIPIAAAGPGGLPEAEAKEVFTLHVGPSLPSGEFVRGIATASPISVMQKLMGYGAAFSAKWWVADADADFDDEVGKTQLRIEAGVHASGGLYVSVEQLAFQVTILATQGHQ